SAPAMHDVVRVDRATGRLVEQAVGDKRKALVGGGAGLVEVDVPASRAAAPALGGARLADLAAIARRLVALDGEAPWEVELAIAGDRTFVLGARKLAGRGFPDGGAADTVWS